VLPNKYEEQNCTIARALEVIGERWTILIVRDALLGVRRFEDFQARLGISRTILTARLAQLVEHGVLDRKRYQRRPDRFEYVLSARGLELWPVIAGLAEWGTRHLTPEGTPPREYRHGMCDKQVHVEARCPRCDLDLGPEEAISVPTSGMPISRAEHIHEPVLAALSQPRTLLEPVRG
jgi:DNA-binding HxlR family transcriptional regulator